MDIGRLRRALAGLPLPAWPDGRIRLAVDVSGWLRPDAATSPERVHCHVRGRGRAAWVAPGWPYSFVAALSPGASSWALLLDAVRLGPDDDERLVTAAQLREVVTRLIAAGHWRDGDPPVLIMMDAGYSPVQLAWLLRDLPVTVVARVRSDRVFRAPAPPRAPGTRGRPARHGPALRCADPATWPGPGTDARAASARHGPVRVHGLAGDAPGPAPRQRLGRLAAAEGVPRHRGHPHPAGRRPPRPRPRRLEPMWIWASDPHAGSDEAAVATLWQSYLRRFDLEHAFRFLRQQLGWGRPAIRDPAAADRWTWLLIACCAQLHLARPLAAAARLPWQRPQGPGQPRGHDPRPGPRRIPRRPPGRRHPRQRRENHPPRPRAPPRLQEQAQGTPPPRPQAPRKNLQASRQATKKDKTDRLNGKVKCLPVNPGAPP